MCKLFSGRVTIKDRLSGKDVKSITVLQACDNYLDMMRKLGSSHYAKPTIIKYTNTKLRLTEWKFRAK